MAQPGAVDAALAVALGVVALPCLARLFVRRRSAGMPHRHEDLGQVLMAVGMVAMLLSLTRLLPTPLWLALFGGQAVAFAVLLSRCHTSERDAWQYTHHVVASVGMAYAVLAVGSGGFAVEPLTAAFGMYFLGYTAVSALRTVTVLRPATVGPPGVPAILVRPTPVLVCRTVMAAAMTFMLLAGM